MDTSTTLDESILAQIEDLTVMGCMACPKDKTLEQRDKYFKGLRFLALEELLKNADGVNVV